MDYSGFNSLFAASLETKPKSTSHSKLTGIWIIEVIPPEVEVKPEDSEDITNTNTPLPVDILRSLIDQVGGIKGDIRIRDLAVDRSKTDHLAQV